MRIRPVLLAFALTALLVQAIPLHAQSRVTTWPRGKPVPVIAMTDLEGRPWNSRDLKGRVVLINFWATWCEPCRAEMPALARIAHAYPREKLVVLAVNYQESAPRVQRYLYNEVLDKDEAFPVLLDSDGAMARAWTQRIFPTTVVLGTDGRPRHVMTGQYDWASPGAAQLLAPPLPDTQR